MRTPATPAAGKPVFAVPSSPVRPRTGNPVTTVSPWANGHAPVLSSLAAAPVALPTRTSTASQTVPETATATLQASDLPGRNPYAPEFVPRAALTGQGLPEEEEVFFDAVEEQRAPVQNTSAVPVLAPTCSASTFQARVDANASFIRQTCRWLDAKVRSGVRCLIAAAAVLVTGSEATRDQLMSEHVDVFGGAAAAQAAHLMPLPMRGPLMETRLKPDAVPSTCLVPRKVPFALEKATQEELAAMANSGLIKRVSEPTPWCSPFLVVLKPKGGVRPVVDYKALNKYVVRPVHPFLAARAAVESIPKSSRFFATLDAAKGYWQIKLSDEASRLTTFLTPYGRYKYTRAPMGLS